VAQFLCFGALVGASHKVRDFNSLYEYCDSSVAEWWTVVLEVQCSRLAVGIIFFQCSKKPFRAFSNSEIKLSPNLSKSYWPFRAQLLCFGALVGASHKARDFNSLYEYRGSPVNRAVDCSATGPEFDPWWWHNFFQYSKC
jgi:hypothetical protein